MNFENNILVNYYHPDCVPLKNILPMPKEEGFEIANNQLFNWLFEMKTRALQLSQRDMYIKLEFFRFT